MYFSNNNWYAKGISERKCFQKRNTIMADSEEEKEMVAGLGWEGDFYFMPICIS